MLGSPDNHMARPFTGAHCNNVIVRGSFIYKIGTEWLPVVTSLAK